MIDVDKAELIIFDVMADIKKQADVLVPLLNEHGSAAQGEAYKRCMYSASVRLGIVIGQDAIDAGKIRHEKIDREVKAYFAGNQGSALRNKN